MGLRCPPYRTTGRTCQNRALPCTVADGWIFLIVQINLHYLSGTLFFDPDTQHTLHTFVYVFPHSAPGPAERRIGWRALYISGH